MATRKTVPVKTPAKFGRTARFVRYLKDKDPERACEALEAAYRLVEDCGGLPEALVALQGEMMTALKGK